MKKITKITAIIIALMMLFSIAACSSNQAASNDVKRAGVEEAQGANFVQLSSSQMTTILPIPAVSTSFTIYVTTTDSSWSTNLPFDLRSGAVNAAASAAFVTGSDTAHVAITNRYPVATSSSLSDYQSGDPVFGSISGAPTPNYDPQYDGWYAAIDVTVTTNPGGGAPIATPSVSSIEFVYSGSPTLNFTVALDGTLPAATVSVQIITLGQTFSFTNPQTVATYPAGGTSDPLSGQSYALQSCPTVGSTLQALYNKSNNPVNNTNRISAFDITTWGGYVSSITDNTSTGNTLANGWTYSVTGTNNPNGYALSGLVSAAVFPLYGGDTVIWTYN